MKKISGNIKAGQYEKVPTFLVVSTARLSVHGRTEELRKMVPWPYQEQESSGHLFTIAAHKHGDPFFFSQEMEAKIVNLGSLQRAGILHDYPFIAGLIFIITEWSKTSKDDAIAQAYQLNGIWNSAWEKECEFSPEEIASAKEKFEQLCHAWNDTENSRSSRVPGSGVNLARC